MRRKAVLGIIVAMIIIIIMASFIIYYKFIKPERYVFGEKSDVVISVDVHEWLDLAKEKARSVRSDAFLYGITGVDPSKGIANKTINTVAGPSDVAFPPYDGNMSDGMCPRWIYRFYSNNSGEQFEVIIDCGTLITIEDFYEWDYMEPLPHEFVNSTIVGKAAYDNGGKEVIEDSMNVYYHLSNHNYWDIRYMQSDDVINHDVKCDIITGEVIT
jgi:hypothetical protein